jgi:hypothetical protein
MLRELDKSFHRPETRRLVDLTNSELTLLFQRRAKELAEALDGHVFWDNECIVYWSTFIELQDYLYEVMMEIQSRYPAKEVNEHMRLLPVMEPRNLRRAFSR